MPLLAFARRGGCPSGPPNPPSLGVAVTGSPEEGADDAVPGLPADAVPELAAAEHVQLRPGGDPEQQVKPAELVGQLRRLPVPLGHSYVVLRRAQARCVRRPLAGHISQTTSQETSQPHSRKAALPGAMSRLGMHRIVDFVIRPDTIIHGPDSKKSSGRITRPDDDVIITVNYCYLCDYMYMSKLM